MTERVALVTGAGRGLGRVMALALLKAGHRVFLTSTNQATLEETRRISGAANRAALATADLGDEENAAQIVKAAEAAFRRVDILINNAGIPNPSAQQPIDIQVDQMRRLFEVNMFAPINLIKQVLPKMVERDWGRIIFISTSLDTMLEPSHVAYGMTKAAGEAFMVALAASRRDVCYSTDIGMKVDMTRTIANRRDW